MEGKIPYQNGQPYSQQCRFRLSKVRYFAFFFLKKIAYIRRKMYFCSRKNGGYTPKKRIWLERSNEISILTV